MYSLSNSYGDSSLTTIPYAANMPDKQLRTELYQSVYNPGYNPLPDSPHIWAKHSNALNRVVAKQNTNPRRWSNEEVIKFIQSVPNCKEIGNIFRQHVCIKGKKEKKSNINHYIQTVFNLVYFMFVEY